jgi:hypothetical protein
MVDHHNACLRLPSTQWMMLLHDDDELYPDSLSRVEPFLADSKDIGIVVGGLQHIDPQGTVHWEWLPDWSYLNNTGFREEDGLLRLGLGFDARSPNTIFDVAKGRHIGGFLEIDGTGADYTFFCQLAYSYGVAFLPDRMGRYRRGHEQGSDLSIPDNVTKNVRASAQKAELLRSIGCSAAAVDQLVDNNTWAFFVWVAPQWLDSDPAFVFELCQKCLLLSPHRGAWQFRARKEYPLLFWQPQWLARLLFVMLHRSGCLIKRRG